MPDVAFPGMRGEEDFVEHERKWTWREEILKLYPNGDTPLAALTAIMRSESAPDPYINWWERLLPSKYTEGTAGEFIYDDIPCTVAYTAPGAAGETYYLKPGSQAESYKYRIGQEILLADTVNYEGRIRAKVISRAAATPFAIGFTLLEADADDGVSLEDCDIAIIIGNMNEAGAGAPASIMYDPTRQWNNLQDFRNSWHYTDIAGSISNLRTGNRVKDWQLQALEDHARDMEMSFLFGIRSAVDRTGTGGEIELLTGGILFFMEQSGSGATISDFRVDETTSSWAEAGEGWLDEQIEEIFRYGSDTKLVLCGSGAMLGINKIVKARGQYEMTKATAQYKMSVSVYESCGYQLLFKRHPLFSQNPWLRNAALVLDTKFLRYRFQKGFDTDIRRNIQTPDQTRVLNEYRTVCGLEPSFMPAHGLLFGVGQDGETFS